MKFNINGKAFTKGQAEDAIKKIASSVPPILGDHELSASDQDFIKQYVAFGERTEIQNAESVMLRWWLPPQGHGNIWWVLVFVCDGVKRQAGYKKLLDDEDTRARKSRLQLMRELVHDQTRTTKEGQVKDHKVWFKLLVDEFWFFEDEECQPESGWEERWVTFHKANAKLECVTPEENQRRAGNQSTIYAEARRILKA